MEKAVPKSVEAQILDAGDWMHAAQHVMPLQDLVQDDPVEESTQTKTEQNAGGSRKLPLSAGRRRIRPRFPQDWPSASIACRRKVSNTSTRRAARRLPSS
jgi:hypothetical protein